MVVGGTSGIGLAAAVDLGRDHQVTVAGRDPVRLAHALAVIGGRAAGEQVDAGDRAQLDSFFARHPPADHLVVAVPADRGGGPFAQLDLADIAAALTGKSLTQLAVVQAALPALAASGSITLIGGATAAMARPATTGIAAANAALHAAARVLAAELAPRRVNVVAPGIIDTPWWDRVPAGRRDALFTDTAARAPAGRVGTAGDVAHAVRFLIENSYVTGVVLDIDGGLRLVNLSFAPGIEKARTGPASPDAASPLPAAHRTADYEPGL